MSIVKCATEDYRPKRTVYKDTLFRSRLEARWAVFFDALEIDWQYEAETVELDPLPQRFWDQVKMQDWQYGKPLYYLPDFFFPDLWEYAEVKPGPFTPLQRWKCDNLAKVGGAAACVLLVGAPANRPYDYICYEDCDWNVTGQIVIKSSSVNSIRYNSAGHFPAQFPELLDQPAVINAVLTSEAMVFQEVEAPH